ncbi:MAG: diguanylate cyclase, partial [Firmicutes bacterium]|nr:diguanylate cyclase [Bacillota bacterium]
MNVLPWTYLLILMFAMFIGSAVQMGSLFAFPGPLLTRATALQRTGIALAVGLAQLCVNAVGIDLVTGMEAHFTADQVALAGAAAFATAEVGFLTYREASGQRAHLLWQGGVIALGLLLSQWILLALSPNVHVVEINAPIFIISTGIVGCLGLIGIRFGVNVYRDVGSKRRAWAVRGLLALAVAQMGAIVATCSAFHFGRVLRVPVWGVHPSFLPTVGELVWVMAVAIAWTGFARYRFDREAGRARMSEMRFRSLFEHNPDPVCALDLTGNIEEVNPSVQRVIGFRPENLIGRNLASLFAESKRLDWQALRRGLVAEEQGQFEVVLDHPDGRQLELSVTSVPIVVDGKVSGTFVIGKDMTEQNRNTRDMNFMAYFDSLTGLANWRGVEDCLVDVLAGTGGDYRVGLILFDVDRFKWINNSLGHAFGDRVIESVGARIQSLCPEGGLVGRLSGDEFALVVPALSTQDVVALARDVLHVMRDKLVVDGRDMRVTLSAGASIYPDDATDPATLFRHADTALGRAKQLGKNGLQVYSESVDGELGQQLELYTDLHRALEEGQFTVHYQPQVHVRSGRIIGVEALVRWQRPGHGLIYPGSFINQAEDTGLILDIGRRVLRIACRQGREWLDKGFPPIRIAVNLSAAQFAAADLVDMVSEVLEETDLPPELLE